MIPSLCKTLLVDFNFLLGVRNSTLRTLISGDDTEISEALMPNEHY